MTRADQITALEAKLSARRDRIGFAANVAAIEEQLAILRGQGALYRHKETGQFVTEEFARANPDLVEPVE